MAKLNQLLAVSKTRKDELNRSITTAHHESTKPVVLAGLTKTYQPKQEDGDQLPSESLLVQLTHRALVTAVSQDMTTLWDVVATIDATNCLARADVAVDDVTVLTDVPVSTLLFLEKQLVDWITILLKLPTLDPAVKWTLDPNTGLYATEPVDTVRTKKVLRNHQIAAATDKHPEQVKTYEEDVIVGTWTTTKFSGALPASEVGALITRARKLRDAVKTAREQANNATAIDTTIGERVFGYLLG